jgi:hypothetical protein
VLERGQRSAGEGQHGREECRAGTAPRNGHGRRLLNVAKATNSTATHHTWALRIRTYYYDGTARDWVRWFCDHKKSLSGLIVNLRIAGNSVISAKLLKKLGRFRNAGCDRELGWCRLCAGTARLGVRLGGCSRGCNGSRGVDLGFDQGSQSLWNGEVGQDPADFICQPRMNTDERGQEKPCLKPSTGLRTGWGTRELSGIE